MWDCAPPSPKPPPCVTDQQECVDWVAHHVAAALRLHGLVEEGTAPPRLFVGGGQISFEVGDRTGKRRQVVLTVTVAPD